MKKIGFIGAYDKTDLMLYIAKLLVETGKKVLIIDSTTNQRARYIVPCITPSVYYITQYEGFDVAVGFSQFDAITNYLGTSNLEYDIILIDVDSNESFNNFSMKIADRNYFVTAFDSYSLKKGMEIIGKVDEKITMKKVLFSREMRKDEDEYLNFLSYYYSIIWEKEKIYFPYEQGDNTIIMENQRSAKMRYREFSQTYKNGLLELVVDIDPTIKLNSIKRIFKIV